MSAATRTDILSQIFPHYSVGAEIGVFEGTFSESILTLAQPSMLYLVDPFSGILVSGNKDGEDVRSRAGEEVYRDLMERFGDCPEVQIHRAPSQEWLAALPDGWLDFIYIDGDHSYDGVSEDLQLAKWKVRSGGIIAGHDYAPQFPGVMKAVNELHVDFGLTTEDGLPSYYFTNLP